VFFLEEFARWTWDSGGELVVYADEESRHRPVFELRRHSDSERSREVEVWNEARLKQELAKRFAEVKREEIEDEQAHLDSVLALIKRLGTAAIGGR
jgi:hypothetical protein